MGRKEPERRERKRTTSPLTSALTGEATCEWTPPSDNDASVQSQPEKEKKADAL